MAGIVVFAVAAPLCAAWLTHAPELTAWASSRMKMNTCVGLLLLDGALLAHLGGGWMRTLARLLAAAALLLGVLTIIEYVTGSQLGIDELLARDSFSFNPESARFPNRMSPNAAVGFVFSGAALLLVPRRSIAALIGHGLALISLAAALTALVGYLYGEPALYKLSSYVRLSPYTAIGLLSISIGTLALRLDVGFTRLFVSRGPGGYLLRRLVGVIIVAPGLFGWLAVEGVRRGLYSPTLASALLAVTDIGVMMLVIVVLGQTLDGVERRRSAAAALVERTATLTAALARAATVEQVADAMLDVGVPALGAQSGAFLIVDDFGDRGRLRLLGSRGYRPEAAARYKLLELSAPLPITEVARTGNPVFISTVAELQKRYPQLPREHVSASGGWAVLPLLGRERALGVAALSFAGAQPFEGQARQRLEHLALQVAQALDRALLFDSEKAARDRAEAAVKAGSVGTFVWDVATDQVSLDPFAAALLGLSAAGSPMPAARFFACIHPADRPRLEAVKGEDAPFEIECRVLAPDDATRWVVARGRLDRTRVPGLLTDITPRKQAEAELERARERLRAASERLHAALEAATIGTYYWDLRSDHVLHDRGVAAIFGLGDADGADSEAFTGRIHAEDRPAWDAALEAARREGSDFELRYRVIVPTAGGDHEVRWVRDKGRTTRGPDGQPLYRTGAVVDFTGEHQARVAVEAASRAKDEFLAMLGHELRNPLSPILTSLQLMKLRGGDQLLRERQVIERQVRHMVRLVDDLLDVSRITRGKVELRRRRVELSEVVAKAIELSSPLFEQRAHRLSAEIPSQGLLVFGDEHRLAQVVSNLLTNAAKYTDEGGHIEVSARRDDGSVVLSVTDSGIGIAPELLPRVFDLFVQGERTLERSQGGLGLGLTLVRTLVEMHGGTVAASSAGLGHGSRFTVRLPLVASAIDSRPAADASLPPVVNPGGGARNIIVVDDNRDAAETLAEALRHAGHHVRVAFDGPSALELDASEHADVAFVDLGLPLLDGYEVARRMRGRDGGTRPRLVAVTGYGQESDRRKSKDVGFDHHLVKPVDLGEALRLVSG